MKMEQYNENNNLSIENFQNMVYNLELLIVYVYGDWCEVCPKYNQQFELLMQEYNSENILLWAENIDNSIFETYEDFQVKVVPTFLIFKKGILKPFKIIEGNITYLKKFLKNK